MDISVMIGQAKTFIVDFILVLFAQEVIGLIETQDVMEQLLVCDQVDNHKLSFSIISISICEMRMEQLNRIIIPQVQSGINAYQNQTEICCHIDYQY